MLLQDIWLGDSLWFKFPHLLSFTRTGTEEFYRGGSKSICIGVFLEPPALGASENRSFRWRLTENRQWETLSTDGSVRQSLVEIDFREVLYRRFIAHLHRHFLERQALGASGNGPFH